MPSRRSRRRGMLMGAAIASSRNKKMAAAQPQTASTDQPDAIVQIAQLAELHKQGILTDAEFEAKKKQLLGL